MIGAIAFVLSLTIGCIAWMLVDPLNQFDGGRP
jgi:hypothetical protein